jgi:hypothetical protein
VITPAAPAASVRATRGPQGKITSALILDQHLPRILAAMLLLERHLDLARSRRGRHQPPPPPTTVELLRVPIITDLMLFKRME